MTTIARTTVREPLLNKNGYYNSVHQRSTIVGKYLYEAPEPQVIMTADRQRPLAIVEEVTKEAQLLVIRISWKNPENKPLRLMVTERDLLALGTVGLTQIQKLKLNMDVRFSLVRNVLSGRYYTEGYYFTQCPEDTAKVFCNLAVRQWRLKYYNFTVDLVDWKPDTQLVSNKSLGKTKDYEQELYKLGNTFKQPEISVPKKGVGVLFMTNLVFKYQTISGVLGRQLIDIKKNTLKPEVYYRWLTQEKRYIDTDKPEQEDEFTYLLEQLDTEIESYKRRQDLKNNKFLQYEKENYPEKYLRAEEKFLKNTFEGSLLFGNKPFDLKGYQPKVACTEDQYMEIERGQLLLSIPKVCWQELHPERVENPNIEKRAVQQLKRQRQGNISSDLYKWELPIQKKQSKQDKDLQLERQGRPLKLKLNKFTQSYYDRLAQQQQVLRLQQKTKNTKKMEIENMDYQEIQKTGDRESQESQDQQNEKSQDREIEKTGDLESQKSKVQEIEKTRNQDFQNSQNQQIDTRDQEVNDLETQSWDLNEILDQLPAPNVNEQTSQPVQDGIGKGKTKHRPSVQEEEENDFQRLFRENAKIKEELYEIKNLLLTFQNQFKSAKLIFE